MSLFIEVRIQLFCILNYFDIPYTNNLAERPARQIKRKSKQVGAFRSFEHTQEYCDFMSIVETGKSNNKNIYELVNEYF